MNSGDLEMFVRFARGARRFLRTALTREECLRIASEAAAAREDNFLVLLKRAIFENPRSPYRALLRHAGAEYGDLESQVRADGVEATAERLSEAGVFLDFEEFKGKKRIERPGLSLEVAAEDFDNPVLTKDFEVLSSGSAGARRRMAVDLELLVYESAVRRLYLEAQGVWEMPRALWRSVPPGAAGLKHALRAAKSGRPLERWFSPTQPQWTRGMWPSAIFQKTAEVAGWLEGGVIPRPEYAPLHDAAPIAEWMQEKVRQGTPPMLSTSASSGVRVADYGPDMPGAVFELGGEAISQAKVAAIAKRAARTINGYAMAEVGLMGAGCSKRQANDDVHMLSGKLAVGRRRVERLDGLEVDALLMTTLHPATPKILLNVDIGDYATRAPMRCGCPMERYGPRIHTIRSHEKLTAGGMHFIGSEILALLEQTLPQRHGGSPGDYQFVEEEEGGKSRVSIAVHPETELRDEHRLPETILESLSRSSRGGRMMAEQWRQTQVIRVVRTAPFVTDSGKTPPIRVMPR